MNGTAVMANNVVIPITAGARRPKRKRVLVHATKGASGIELEVQLTSVAAVSATQPNSAGACADGTGSKVSGRWTEVCEPGGLEGYDRRQIDYMRGVLDKVSGVETGYVPRR